MYIQVQYAYSLDAQAWRLLNLTILSMQRRVAFTDGYQKAEDTLEGDLRMHKAVPTELGVRGISWWVQPVGQMKIWRHPQQDCRVAAYLRGRGGSVL